MTETLIGLFVSAFVSATLFPGGSEAILVYLVSQQPTTVITVVLVATFGNTFGSLTSYLIGYLGSHQKTPHQLLKHKKTKALDFIERYGVWSLLFAWLPVIGDALPLLAGWFRFGFISSTLLIFIGKLLRYTLLALVAIGVITNL